MLTKFHLSIPVRNLAAARAFYEGTLNQKVVRETAESLHFDFFGHHLVVHEYPNFAPMHYARSNDAPHPHFGVVLRQSAWRRIVEGLIGSDADFIEAPARRYAGEVFEQEVAFVRDPSGNIIEFKYFEHGTEIR